MPKQSTAPDVAAGISRSARLTFVTFALAALPSCVAAQQQAQVAVFGGVVTDQLGRRSNAVGLSPSVTFGAGPNLSAQLTTTVTRLGAQAWSLGGGASFSAREPIGRALAFVLRGDGGVTGLRGSGTGTWLQGELSPSVELAIARTRVFGGARLMGGSASQHTRLAGPGLFGPATQERTMSRGGAGAMYGAAVTLYEDGQASAALSAREERATIAGASFIDRVAGAALVLGPVSLSASAGRRDAPDEQDTFGSVTLALPLAATATLELSGGRFASSRVLGTPAGEFMSVGISWHPARAVESRLPVPADAGAPARGMTRISIRARDARTVELAGDFSGWQLLPARRASNGVWYADVRIPPGRYRYAFRLDGTRWSVPDGATAVDDGFGGKSAWLVVERRQAP